MKYYLLVILLILPNISFANLYTKTQIDTHTIEYITYDTNSEMYDIQIGISKEGGDNLENIMNNYGGITALNGVFFCPSDYTKCGGKTFTINERFTEGREISTYESTGDRVVFGWNKEQEAFLYQTDKINADKKKGIYEGFANFPLLLQSGKNALEYYYDVGLIDTKLSSPVNRHFICTDESREHIYFGRVFSVDLDSLVGVLSKLGCYDALNLDAGNSSAFIYNGRYIAGPGRDITDGVIIKRTDIDTVAMKNHVSEVFQKMEQIYLKKPDSKKAKEKLQSYRKQLTELRRELYEKYSTDLLSAEGKSIGYQIDVTSTTAFQKIYLINLIDSHIIDIIQKL